MNKVKTKILVGSLDYMYWMNEQRQLNPRPYLLSMLGRFIQEENAIKVRLFGTTMLILQNSNITEYSIGGGSLHFYDRHYHFESLTVTRVFSFLYKINVQP